LNFELRHLFSKSSNHFQLFLQENTELSFDVFAQLFLRTTEYLYFYYYRKNSE